MYRIKIPLFNANIYVYEGPLNGSHGAILDKWNIDITERPGAAGFTTHSIDDFGVLLCLYEDNIDTLMHEMIHVSGEVLRSRGIEHTTQTEEVYAYVVTYVARAVLKRRERKLDIKKVLKESFEVGKTFPDNRRV